MIIKRKKSAFYTNLSFSIAFGVLYILLYTDSESFRITRGLPYIFITCWYIAQSIYIFRTPQLAINENTVTQYTFPKKTMQIADIISMDYAAGDYIFRSNSKNSIRLTKDQIHPDELEKFDKQFNILRDLIARRNLSFAKG